MATDFRRYGLGAHADIPEATYHADKLLDEPTLNNSVAKALLAATPLHAWTAHPRLNPGWEPTVEDAFDIGSAAHSLLRSGEAKIHVVDAPKWTKKDAREERDEARAAGKLPLLTEQWERVQIMALCARKQLDEHEIGQVFDSPEGFSDITALWRKDGVAKRCRFDRIFPDARLIVDLKTTGESAEPMGFGRTVARYGYDIQEAHYTEGAAAVYGGKPDDWTFLFVVLEKDAPHGLSVVALNGSDKEFARIKARRAADLWRACLTSGRWIGYPAKVVTTELPAWAERAWMDREVRDSEIKQRTGKDALEAAFAFQSPSQMKEAV